MKIGILRDGVCIDVCVFDSLGVARDFLSQGVWKGANQVLSIPGGFGIGDKYSNGKWERLNFPENPEPTPISLLQEENKLLKSQLQAQTERSDFIEDCIAEMAMMVYGEV